MLRLLLLLLLVLPASACSRYTCDDARQELDQRPERATDLPDGRYALGLSASRTLLDRVFAQSIEDGRGFPRHVDLDLALPSPAGRRRGAGSSAVRSLTVAADASCDRCLALAVIAEADVDLGRATLNDVSIEAVVDARVEALADGRTLVLTAEVARVRDVRLRIERARLRELAGQLAGRAGGDAGRLADVVLDSEVGRALLAALEEELRGGLAQALTEAVRATVGERELARVELPTLGSQAIELSRADVHGSDDGVFVGLDPKDWPAGDGVKPFWSEHDLGIALPSHSSTELVDRAMRGGVLPSGVDLSGQPASDGELQLRAADLRPDGDGFVVALRAFQVQGACGRVELRATGAAVVDEGSAVVSLGAFEASDPKGSGRAVAAGLALHDRFSSEQLELVQEVGGQTSIAVLGHPGTLRLRGLGAQGDTLLAEADVRWRPARDRGGRDRADERRDRDRRRRGSDRSRR